MNTLHFKSTKIVLVKQNQIPIIKLVNSIYINELVRIFKFNNVIPLQDQTTTNIIGITCSNGLLELEGGKQIPIEGLTIEPRKIGLQVEGSSDFSDIIYKMVKDFLLNLVDIRQDDMLSPVIEVNETELISQLNFNADSLFSDSLYKNISTNFLEKSSSDIVEARLGGFSMSFQIDYEPLNFSLVAENRLNITRKELIIQVAPGYGLKDKVYFTKAALSTEKHIEFLEGLEKTFNKK